MPAPHPAATRMPRCRNQLSGRRPRRLPLLHRSLPQAPALHLLLSVHLRLMMVLVAMQVQKLQLLLVSLRIQQQMV